jgi:hypothetical protein
MPTTISVTKWAKELAGFSPAEVELMCFDAMRRAVLAHEHAVSDAVMAVAVQRMVARQSAMLRTVPTRPQTGE